MTHPTDQPTRIEASQRELRPTHHVDLLSDHRIAPSPVEDGCALTGRVGRTTSASLPSARVRVRGQRPTAVPSSGEASPRRPLPRRLGRPCPASAWGRVLEPAEGAVSGHGNPPRNSTSVLSRGSDISPDCDSGRRSPPPPKGRFRLASARPLSPGETLRNASLPHPGSMTGKYWGSASRSTGGSPADMRPGA